MNVLAIDPGMSGSAVLIGTSMLDVRTDFRHMEDITRAVDELGGNATAAVIELVASRPGQGIASMFEFGRTSGVALGALHSNGFSTISKSRKPLIEVTPYKWQKYFRQLDGHVKKVVNRGPPGFEMPFERLDPFDSRAIVRKYFPSAMAVTERAKDHNTADAILMGIWYFCTAPEFTALRARDRKQLPWLLKHFNPPQEKD